MKPKHKKTHLTDNDIDKIVEAQAGDSSAWGKLVTVRRAKPAALSLPADLAARATFFAGLHREKNVGKWITQIIKERVELEEVAFSEAKRAMSLRNGA